MTLQERIKEKMNGLTENEKQRISDYLIEQFGKYPTSAVRLVGETGESEVRTFRDGGHSIIEVPALKLEKTKEWLLSEGMFLNVWRSPFGDFNGYNIYMHPDYSKS